MHGVTQQHGVTHLTKLAHYFAKDEEDFPPELMKMKAKFVRETIRAIESSTNAPKLCKIQ